MADDDVTQDEQPEEVPQKEDRNLKHLREQAAEAAAAKRELVFVKAGIDTDSKLGKLALAGYEGDLTVEAVKAFATEIGAIGAESKVAEVEFTDDERALAGDRQVLAGVRTDPGQDEGEDPQLAGLKAFMGRVQGGSTRERASGEYFDRVIDAAAKGDQRVLYDPTRFHESLDR